MNIGNIKVSDPLTASDFLKMMREKKELVEIDSKLANRSVNEGFSGGEKKKNEIFQMAMLEPKLAILDETDSGLDIDALRIVANGVNKLKRSDNSFIVITHYQRLLDYIVPDVVHVLYDGRIVKTAGKELALELEEKGYDWIKKEIEKHCGMNVKTEITDKYLNLYDENIDKISGKSSDFINTFRADAFDRFRALGIPTRKNEAYKYTNLNTFFDHDYESYFMPVQSDFIEG